MWENELRDGGLCSPSAFLVRDVAPSTYSFIIQSEIFVPLLVTHRHQPPPQPPNELPINPSLSSMLLPSTESIVFLISFQFHQVVAVQL